MSETAKRRGRPPKNPAVVGESGRPPKNPAVVGPPKYPAVIGESERPPRNPGYPAVIGESGRPPRGRPVVITEESVIDLENAPIAFIDALMPKKITMQRPFGYLNDDGEVRMWYQNQMVTDVAEIEEIICHGCLDWQ